MTAGLHLPHQIVDRLGVGCERGRAHQRADRLPLVRVGIVVDAAHQVFDVQDADDVVQVFPDHRDPAETGPQRQ
ncbi:hypothetical protein SDC9_137170 [bioreactor metagenome]|uniref:Uncharacterized protein n=1 Tax=bioreactor metagenome TaxID=1076179 RepID=A0A645DKT5_9ZZZZ